MENVTIYQRPGAITCDFQGVKNQLEAYLREYDGVVFTEDTKAEAKKTVADLRKDQKEFQARIKEAKAEYMKPWEQFNEQALELVNMFDKPICFINDQISAFEETRKKDKQAICQQIYQELVFEDDICAYLPFSKVYNEKWLNATYSEKAIKDDIMTAKMNVKTGLATITSLKSDVEEKALEVFKQTLDMAEAIKVITSYEESKRIALAAEKTKITEEVKAEVEQAKEQARAEAIENLIPVEDGSEVVAYAYSIFLNADAKAKLEAYMDSVGIEFFCRRENK